MMTRLWPWHKYFILSSNESMASKILRTGLKRMRIALLLVIICIFVDSKVIVTCYAHIYKWVIYVVSKEMLQTCQHLPLKDLDAFSHHDPTEIEWCLTIMVFPVVMYGCESWTIKKAKRQRIDAFELWCWRRLLRVPWTARRSNQSILKRSVLGVHWNDWYWSWNSNTLATWCE